MIHAPGDGEKVGVGPQGVIRHPPIPAPLPVFHVLLQRRQSIDVVLAVHRGEAGQRVVPGSDRHPRAVSGGQKLRPEPLQLPRHVLPTPQRIHQSQTSLLLLLFGGPHPAMLGARTQASLGVGERRSAGSLWGQAGSWGGLESLGGKRESGLAPKGGLTQYVPSHGSKTIKVHRK